MCEFVSHYKKILRIEKVSTTKFWWNRTLGIQDYLYQFHKSVNNRRPNIDRSISELYGQGCYQFLLFHQRCAVINLAKIKSNLEWKGIADH